MQVTAPALYLNSEARSFKDDSGREVEFFRIKFLDADYEPMELGISREAFGNGLPFDKLDNIYLTINITPGRSNGVRCQVVNVQAVS